MVFLYSLALFNARVLANAQVARFPRLHGIILPVTQMHMKIVTLMTACQKIMIPPKPPPDPVALWAHLGSLY